MEFVERVKTDYEYRTFFTSGVSLLITAAFACYNMFCGIFYGTEWNTGIGIYYILLVAVKVFVLSREIKFYKDGLEENQKREKRKKILLAQSIMLCVIDFALIAPVSFMVMEKREVGYSQIPAITIAAYTTYKMIMASVNYVKTKKADNLSVKIIRKVNFIDAFVSVLLLQHTLVMTFGGGVSGDLLVLCAVSSFLIWAFLIVLSVLSLIQSIKLCRKKTKPSDYGGESQFEEESGSVN